MLQVSALVLEKLFNASEAVDSTFEVRMSHSSVPTCANAGGF